MQYNKLKTIPPSIYNAFNICPRQAWLMSRQLTADQANEFLQIGRLIDANSFNREKKKVYLADIGAIVDLVIRKDEILYIAEIKKSSRTLESGVLQLKYYLYLIKKNKGLNVKGLIKIPKERISREVLLTERDMDEIEKTLKKLELVLSLDKPPKLGKKMKVCKTCAHYEFCWS